MSDEDQVIEVDEIHIGPQAGPQTQFLETTADIAIYGGSAGGGKSFALLLDPIRHYNNPEFGGVIFRKNSTMVRNQGGLWDESEKLYQKLGAHPREAFLDWTFPDGGNLKFGHLEHERSVYDWQGSQIPYIGFDELTHFSEKQFFYMLSRNRSTSGIPGYVRATCNPDRDSWVRTLIDWYIKGDDYPSEERGFPIPERSGVLRWFVRIDDKIVWANSREELTDIYGESSLPTSFTFIPAKLTDNKILMEKDPQYLARLNSLQRVERMRLLGGNWDVREKAGEIFQEQWFPIVDVIPAGWVRCIRFWDRAATKPSEANKNPDWTRGLKMYQYANGIYLVADVKSLQDTPGQVERLIKTVASHDGYGVRIVAQQDPGSAGVLEKESFIKLLAGYDVDTMVTSKDKLTRAKPVSAQAEHGNIWVLRGDWNKDFFLELEDFPEGDHDDQVDVLSGAFNELTQGVTVFDSYTQQPH